MAERQATIASSSGLHARPAKLFVQAVKEAGVPVTIAVDGGPDLNAGSISYGVQGGDLVIEAHTDNDGVVDLRIVLQGMTDVNALAGHLIL